MTSHRRATLVRVAILVLVAVFAAPALARQDEPAERGIFITVANPITSDIVNSIKERVARAQRDKPVAKIVFDFNPDGKDAGSADFGPCVDLAELIGQLNVRTIAFVHGTAARHTVLPVMACQELVMSSTAVLGPVLVEKDSTLNDLKKGSYDRVARTAYQGLVQKMYDRDVTVLEGRLNNAAVYLDARNRAQAERDGVVGIASVPGLAAGAVAKYTADEALKFGLCQAKLESKQEVAERFGLSPSSLREDPLQGRAAVAWLIKVQGPIDRGSAETLRRRIDRALRHGANVIFLDLDAAGGEFAVAEELAEDIRKLKGPDDQPVLTVAYIPRSAPDTSTFLAVACTEMVMAKGAKLGQFRQPQEQRMFPGRPRPPRPPVNNLGTIGTALAKLAEAQGYPPLVFQALVDPDIEVWRVVGQKGVAERKFVTKEELEADRQGEKKWGQESLVKPVGQLLELTAEKARDFGIANPRLVNNPDDLHELYAIYGVSSAREPGIDFLDKLAVFLADPAVAMFLVILGITCLILELKMPGIGVPGVIAAVCFLLFFWSQTQNSEMTVLAVLLFLLGLALIGIEVFFLPGMGVLGISGILLVLAGLGLATVERLPQTSQEWAGFSWTLTKFGVGMVAATVCGFVIAHFLPSIPYANRLVLAPPGEKEGAEDTNAASANYESLAALLGAIGTAATMLRPAGMARFGDAYVDVVTEGGYVPAGVRVQVIEIEGNRVVVKEV